MRKTSITIWAQRTLLSLLTLFPLLPLVAGENHHTAMSLSDCMSYAVSNSTQMRIREAAVGDAQISRREAILKAFLPSVSAGTNVYYNFGRSIDPQTNTYFHETSFHNNYSLRAGIILFDGFSAVNNVRISRTSLLMGHTEKAQAESEICLAVMQAFCTAVYYGRLQQIQAEQVTLSEQACAKARAQERLGQKSHADVVQMEANLADSEYDLVICRNSYSEHLSTLSDLMFWPSSEPLVIDMELSEEETACMLPDAQDVIAFAQIQNPSVLLAEWKLKNAQREFHTARWRRLPTLGLYSGWSTSYYSYGAFDKRGFTSQLRNNSGEYIELSLSIPIFDGLGRHSDMGRKRNAVVKATAEYDQKKHDIESEVIRAYSDYQGALNAYSQACRKAELQEEAFRLNTKKLEQGLISTIEHQSSANSRLRAMADRLNTRLQLLIKRSVVRYYNGEDYLDQFIK